MATKLLDIQAAGRQFVDRYELIGEIASGGMATVFLARLTGAGGFQRLYAIKRLHPHLAGEKEFVEMFLDEARLAAGIHHPNVVPILEVGASPTGYYLVMEYIEGETLARLLARASSGKVQIPPAVTIRIGVDMLQGLHAAHELRDETGALAGLVHRDVSPQNVLVGVDGVTRITDFGVARAASRLNATRVGQLKGKIAYMAPEQARGDENIDRRADIFAAGIVIWEGLAHRRLFKAENEAATLARVISEPIPHLRETGGSIPRPVADVVMKALERNLEARFSTCAEFAEALERAAHTSGMLASNRDLQAYLNQVLGGEIQEHRNAVRAWVARTEGDPSLPVHQLLTPSGARPTVNGTSELSMAQSLPRHEPKKNWLLLLVPILLIGLGAFGFVAYKNVVRKGAPKERDLASSGLDLDLGKEAPSAPPTAAPELPPAKAAPEVGDSGSTFAPSGSDLNGKTLPAAVKPKKDPIPPTPAEPAVPVEAASPTTGQTPAKPKKPKDDPFGSSPYR